MWMAHVWRRDRLLDSATSTEVLTAAYRMCRRSRPGHERTRFEQAWPRRMAEIAASLRAGRLPTHRRRRFRTRKADGGWRAIEVPSLAEASAQRAVLLAITPVLEKRFLQSSYGWRPGRDRLDALREVHRFRRDGCTHVFRTDIAACFNELDHHQLNAALGRLLPSRGLRSVIAGWLRSVGERRRSGR